MPPNFLNFSKFCLSHLKILSIRLPRLFGIIYLPYYGFFVECCPFLSTFYLPCLSRILWLKCELILLISQQLDSIETSGFHKRLSALFRFLKKYVELVIIYLDFLISWLIYGLFLLLSQQLDNIDP